jgi:PhnB protein
VAYISPLLAVDDVAQSMDYYERVLGFKKGLALTSEGGMLTHGEMHIGDLMLMLSPAQQVEGPRAAKLAQGGAKGAGILLYLDLGEQDIDRYYEDVKRAGARIIEEIQDQFWGDRTFTIEDPDGYILTFSKHVRDVDFSQMEQPQQ